MCHSPPNVLCYSIYLRCDFPSTKLNKSLFTGTFVQYVHLILKWEVLRRERPHKKLRWQRLRWSLRQCRWDGQILPGGGLPWSSDLRPVGHLHWGGGRRVWRAAQLRRNANMGQRWPSPPDTDGLWICGGRSHGQITSTGGTSGPPTTRKRIESVVTRVLAPSTTKPTPGWILGPLHAAEEGQVVASVLAVAAGGDHPAGELPEETGGTPTRERPDGQKAKVIYSFNKLNSFFVYIKSYKWKKDAE